MLTCRRVGQIVTDVNNHLETAILTCRRVGNIVTDVNNYRDTAMIECRRVGHIVTDVNNHRDADMLGTHTCGYQLQPVRSLHWSCLSEGKIRTIGGGHTFGVLVICIRSIVND